jgi:hypothetical protein
MLFQDQFQAAMIWVFCGFAIPELTNCPARLVPASGIDQSGTSVCAFDRFETSRDVRISVAVGRNPDVARTSHFGSVLPICMAGRALQAGCEQMVGGGLAHLYPAIAWSVCAPGHHGYPRAHDLILGKALRGRLGHQITGTTARPFLHLLNPTTRPRRVSSRLVRRVLRSCVPASTRSRRRGLPILIMRGDNTSLRLARMSGSCWRRKRSP